MVGAGTGIYYKEINTSDNKHDTQGMAYLIIGCFTLVFVHFFLPYIILGFVLCSIIKLFGSDTPNKRQANGKHMKKCRRGCRCKW
jgi:hypothetical protein